MQAEISLLINIYYKYYTFDFDRFHANNAGVNFPHITVDVVCAKELLINVVASMAVCMLPMHPF